MEKISKIRNIGISAHIDSGKTTLSERILFYAGRIHRMQEVHAGQGGATMDFMELERERGITITSAATQVTWHDKSINLIDTPGHVDFTVEVERSLRVLDGAIMILCAVGGVQSQSITVDQQMKRYRVPRIAFVNKMDRIGADPDRVRQDLTSKLGLNVVPIQLNMGRGDDFKGVIDLIAMEAITFAGKDGEKVIRGAIPEAYAQAAEKARHDMLEALSMYNDCLLEMLLENQPVGESLIRRVIREATINRDIVPMMMGAAFKNKGVQPLLDAVCDYLPSPLDRSYFARDHDNEGTETPLPSDPDAPLVAMVALEIRSAEFFWIVIFAMSTIGAIGAGPPIKGLMSGILGLVIGTAGMHPMTGTLRYTFGQPSLYEGVPVIVALVGLFSISQVLTLAEGRGMDTQLHIPRIGRLWPGWGVLWSLKKCMLRSSLLGTAVGVIPGAGADIASFIGRSEAGRVSREPEKFGKGSLEGVCSAEAANNGVVGGSLIPMLTLGIPGNAVTAALLGGLLIHGLIPGPHLFRDAPDVLYPFIFSLFLANIFFAVGAFGGLRWVARVVLVPQGIIAPMVTALAVIGAYSFRNMVFDMGITLLLGFIGYALRKARFPLAPIILGIILGPLAEENLDRVITLAAARGTSVFGFFLSRTLTVVMMLFTLTAIGYTFYRDYKRRMHLRKTVGARD